jgi:hypothetical protein
MDTAVIFALVLSAIFLGCILWLVIYSRLQKGGAVPARRAGPPADKNLPGRRAAERD